ncbi:bZIP transcription factor [Pacificoceanicola onchidii]|uniref:bZIP transcription factor n=1 Tax=Pacificoceanicola onchidii TaxID=2562685 RepID=UPI0010A32FAD|nr:bZIP transcription factor [Pacificoceanicola onchidii]
MPDFARPSFVCLFSLSLFAAPAFAEELVNDDLRVTGDARIQSSGCFGSGCQAIANIKDADITISSPTPQIDVFDTTGSSPGSRDWSLLFNDPIAPLDYFAIKDQDANSVPFQIEGDAASGSLYVGTLGRVGVGTTVPQANMHILGTGGATLRFESGGAAPQSWQMAATPTSYYLSDITYGSLPFQIRRDSPDYSLSVHLGGNVGMGILSAADALHVYRETGTAGITVENAPASGHAVREMFKMVNHGGSYFTLANTVTNNEWYFVHENNTQGRFMINHSDGGLQMGLTKEGNLTLLGELFTAGSCAAGCDRVFDEDYPLPTIPEQAAMMRERKHLPNVGPTPEDGPFNITKMTGGMLNELEKAHLYIAELEERLSAQEQRNVSLEARLLRLEEQSARP